MSDLPGEALLYRYSVKCDRERFLAIEAEAQRRGLTSTAFVQLHFEGILDAADPTAVEESPKTGPKGGRALVNVTREEIEAAQRHGLTPGELRVYRAIAASDDGFGQAEIGVGSIAAATGQAEPTVRVFISRLIKAGRLRRMSAAGFRRTTVYQLKQLEDA